MADATMTEHAPKYPVESYPIDDARRGNNDESLSRSEFWMRIAGGTFAVWALMIPVGVAMIRSSFNELTDANRTIAASFGEYRLATERRITLLEERQLVIAATNLEHDRRMRALELGQAASIPPLLRR